MFDCIGFKVHNFTDEDFENFLLASQVTVKSENDFRVVLEYGNLRINYYRNSQTLHLTNSVHKFFNHAIRRIGLYNHNLFCFSQFREVIEHFENQLQRPAKDFLLVGTFEFGLNVDTGLVSPFSLAERYLSSVTTASNPFFTQYNPQGKPFLRFCSFTDYKIKAYDKGKQAGLSGRKILRFEIVCRNIRQVRKILKKDIPTLEHLKSEESWHACQKFLMRSYDSIRMLPYPEDGLTNYVEALFHGHPTLKRDFKDKLGKTKRLTSHSNIHLSMRSSMERTYHQLIQN